MSNVFQKTDDAYIAVLLTHTKKAAQLFGSLQSTNKLDDAEHYFRDICDDKIITFPTFLMNLLKNDGRYCVFDDKTKKSHTLHNYMTMVFCQHINKLSGSRKRTGAWDYEKIIAYCNKVNNVSIGVL